MCLAAVAAAVGGGCGGPIPRTNYYVLHLPAGLPQSREPVPYSVAVMPFRVPDYLEQDRLAFRPSAVEVDFYEYHRWADRPAAMLTTALIERLKARRVFSGVFVYDGRTKPDFLIRGRLDRLDEIDEQGGVSVRVELSAEALELKTNHAVWSGAAAQSGTVKEGEVRAVVQAMSEAAGACLDQIATGLEGFARGLPASAAVGTGP
jgi:ABC-type uncharacterized transport system auxiliary subunit